MKYLWRKLSDDERKEVLVDRKRELKPWHSPAHYHTEGVNRYLFTGTCLNHASIIGYSNGRMSAFEGKLNETVQSVCGKLFAWVILPNHYHFLGETDDAVNVLSILGKLHGRTSYYWNGEEKKRGRQVWFNATETAIKSEGHFFASVNYIHHNPVKHGYVKTWSDWPWSSAAKYLEDIGRDEAERIWSRYPIKEYGKGWDD